MLEEVRFLLNFKMDAQSPNLKPFLKARRLDMDNKRGEITCNRCGKTKEVTDYGYEDDQFHKIELVFGYGSNFDTERWNFQLCEDCIIEYVKAFKYQPKKTAYL
jgi:hypothetical protein